MPILLVTLLIGVLAYLWWRWRYTTLTRECRWREDRSEGLWRCAACGGKTDHGPPRICVKDQQ